MSLVILVHSNKKSKVYSVNGTLPFAECIYQLELRFLEDTGEEATGHLVVQHDKMQKYKVNANKGLDEFEVWGEDERAAFAKALTIFNHRYNKQPSVLEIKK
jgi:hypothetical protein